jgi:hypothetical protein
MTYPHPSRKADLCEISQHRNGSGSATAVFEVERPGTIHFGSTYDFSTQAEKPFFGGIIVAAS